MKELWYRILKESDAVELAALWTDPEVIRYTNIAHPCTWQETEDRIQQLKQFDVFVVFSGEEMIGLVGCPSVDKEKSQYGLFYQMKKEAWGKGYGTAATGWMLDFMRKKDQHAAFFADVVEENIASIKILEHFGFVCAAKEEEEHQGKKRTIRNYVLLPD